MSPSAGFLAVLLFKALPNIPNKGSLMESWEYLELFILFILFYKEARPSIQSIPIKAISILVSSLTIANNG